MVSPGEITNQRAGYHTRDQIQPVRAQEKSCDQPLAVNQIQTFSDVMDPDVIDVITT